MPREQPGQPPSALTPEQAARVDYARRDLESARAQMLEVVPPAGLVLLVARLLTRLDDVLLLVDEVVDDREHP